jgi:3-methyladenine DNA glycosylase AlkD
MSASEVVTALFAAADPARAEHSARFFKTGRGEYGEGDVFIGLTVPQTREVAREYRDLPPAEVLKLLNAREHEVRLCGVVILTNRFRRSRSAVEEAELFALYLSSVRSGHINNWDLIDVSAPTFGELLLADPERRLLLDDLAASPSLWQRRLSLLFTFAFIRAGEFDDTLAMAQYHLTDTHDLIHKAVGWMLREVGNRDIDVLRAFLEKFATRMPRTALRYAIEKFDEPERKAWLAKR